MTFEAMDNQNVVVDCGNSYLSLVDCEPGLVEVLFDLVVVHVGDGDGPPEPRELFVRGELHFLADVSQKDHLLLVCSPVYHWFLRVRKNKCL